MDSIKNFDALNGLVAKKEKRVVILAAGHDEHALEAVLKANAEGVVDYLITGRADDIKRIGGGLGTDIPANKLRHAETDQEAAALAVSLVRSTPGSFLMKGKLETSTLLKAALDKENGIRAGSVMSHIAVYEVPKYHKLLGITDGGMIPYPTLEQKKSILTNALNLFRALGYAAPKVSALAASETVSPHMPETSDAKELKELAAAGEFGSCVFDGPLSFDLTFSRESAEIKGFVSPVTGEADILLMPNIACGNILGKSLGYMGGARMAGCIVGAKVPIVLSSRGASAEEKHLSLLLCAAIS